MSLTVIIPTKDEAVHIERCVAAALPLGRVIVVDSGSDDTTRELAERAGADVVEHPWAGYAAQKNWALDEVTSDADWVLFIDADEVVTPALRAEIAGVLTAETDGWWIPRLNVFGGRPLRHVWWYPDYQLRLFRPRTGRFEERAVHEHVILEGIEGFLDEPLIHENLKGIDEFLRRHERYADLEAREIVRSRAGDSAGVRKGSFVGTWPERRRALKTRVWYRLPARPLLRFFWMYVVKRGFLDGRQGLVYAELIAAYEAMIDAKVFELERARD